MVWFHREDSEQAGYSNQVSFHVVGEIPYMIAGLTLHGFSLNVAHGNAAADLGEEVHSQNVDGQGNFVVAGNSCGYDKAAPL